MKKMKKRFLSALLALAILVAMLPVVDAQAATKTENMTLYVGEAIYYSNFSEVKSVKSSKKSVVKVEKDKKNNTHANLTAKKAGKSKVTIRTERGTIVVNVTVKKLDLKVSLKEVSEGNVLVSVKNNTKQTFDYAEISYTLRGTDGAELETSTKTVSDLVAGKTSYANIAYSTYSFTIDITQCTARAQEVTRTLSASYKERAGKVKITDSVDMDVNPGYATVTLSMKNKSSSSVSGTVFIMVYNSSDQLIGARPVAVYLKGNAAETETVKLDTTYTYKDYSYYKLEKCLYSKIYD